MKLTILQQDLLPPLQAVTRSSGVKVTLPVLANVLLRAEEGILKLSATNLEIGVIKEVKAMVIKKGELTVPAKTFLEIISSLQGAEIQLSTDGDLLKIESKNFSSTLNGIPAAEFPAIPLSSDTTIKLSGNILRQAIPEIAFASAADEGRPVLTGILTEIKKDGVEFVATDGFRLAHKLIRTDSKANINFKALIPRRTFEEAVRLASEDLNEKNTQLEIGTSESQNQLIFKIGSTQLSSRLIEGNFPAWEKIIPTTFENKTVVDRQEFLKAVKISSVFARNESNIIKIETAENKLKFSSEARELGGQNSEIDATVEGNEIVIAFNSKFLIDALSSFNTKDVEINFSGNLSPMVLKPLGEEGLEYVVMPIKLS